MEHLTKIKAVFDWLVLSFLVGSLCWMVVEAHIYMVAILSGALALWRIMMNMENENDHHNRNH